MSLNTLLLMGIRPLGDFPARALIAAIRVPRGLRSRGSSFMESRVGWLTSRDGSQSCSAGARLSHGTRSRGILLEPPAKTEQLLQKVPARLRVRRLLQLDELVPDQVS